MRVAALDYGKTRVGVAVSDELGMMAHPRKPFDAQNRKSLLEAIAALAKEDEISLFVVGIPLDRDGEAGIEARRAERFAEQVASITQCDVQLWDERLTTVEASRRLREGGIRAKDARSRIDSAAACVMLQAYLDGQGGAAR
jgi:putative Holliday junction resolvase